MHAYIVRPLSQIVMDEIFNAASVIVNVFNQKRHGEPHNNAILTIVKQKFKVFTDIFFSANIWHTYPPLHIKNLKKFQFKIIVNINSELYNCWYICVSTRNVSRRPSVEVILGLYFLCYIIKEI